MAVVQNAAIEEHLAIAERMTGTIDRLKSRGSRGSEIPFWEGMRNYYQRATDAARAGRPVLCCGMFVPHELFVGMDIPYYIAENHGVMTFQSDIEGGIALFDTAERAGMASDICSPHRAATGLALLGRSLQPQAVVHTATTCDQTIKLYEVLADIHKVPNFLIDTPYGARPADIAYAKENMQELIAFLEQQFNAKLDPAKLREALEISHEAYSYWEKICELRKAVPCPTGGREAVKDTTILLVAAGRQESVDYFKARYQELKDKVDKKEGIIPDEKYRLAWLYVLPFFDLKMADWLQDTYKAVIVLDTFGINNPDITLDPEDPLGFLAKKPLKRRFTYWSFAPSKEAMVVEDLAQMCRDFKADAAVLLSHWSCQQWCGMTQMLRDKIIKDVGIPFLTVNGDLLDPRVVSSEDMRSNLAEFFTSVMGA